MARAISLRADSCHTREAREHELHEHACTSTRALRARELDKKQNAGMTPSAAWARSFILFEAPSQPSAGSTWSRFKNGSFDLIVYVDRRWSRFTDERTRLSETQSETHESTGARCMTAHAQDAREPTQAKRQSTRRAPRKHMHVTCEHRDA